MIGELLSAGGGFLVAALRANVRETPESPEITVEGAMGAYVPSRLRLSRDTPDSSTVDNGRRASTAEI